jgi:ABC-type sugar transport system ATPase subunit
MTQINRRRLVCAFSRCSTKAGLPNWQHPWQFMSPPADTYDSGFTDVPKMSTLDATVMQDGAATHPRAGPLLHSHGGRRAGRAGGELTLGITPEHLVLAPADMEVIVEAVEPTRS